MRPISRETIIDRRQPRLRWSAVFAGAVLSLGLWILLQVLGMGIGLASIDTDESGQLRGIGIGTGIWSSIAPAIAMFLGAYFAGWLSSSLDRKVGAMHGVVMWALATAFGVWAMLSAVHAIAGGVMRADVAVETAAPSASVGYDDTATNMSKVAREAADATGKVLLVGGLMMLVSLGAALGGGALGVPRRRDARPSGTTSSTLTPAGTTLDDTTPTPRRDVIA